jgi:NHLM bacteriocin system ABC transporter peptidase/ATP-binding protein
MEALECGAAALAMILAYYGKRVPLEELRVVCGVTRSGSKASSLVRAAGHYGLVGRGFRREVDQLHDLPLPAIIHWNFNHYVVLDRLARRHAMINDPAEGPRKVAMTEFSDAFTGVVLTFTPTPDFVPGGRLNSFVWTMAGRLRGARGALLYILLASLCLVLPGAAIPAFTQVFVDEVLVAQLRGWVGPLLAGMAITAILRGALTWVQQRTSRRLAAKLAVTMTSGFIWHVLHLPRAFFAQRYSGDIAARVIANDTVATFLSGPVPVMLSGAVTVAAYLAVMACYDIALATIGLALVLANVALLAMTRRHRANLARRLTMLDGRASAVAVDMVRSIETIKAAGLEQPSFARWAGFQARALSAEQEQARWSALFVMIPGLIQALAMVAVLGLGSLRVIDGTMSIGTLVALQALVASLGEPIAAIARFTGQLQMATSELARLDDVLRHQRDPLREGLPEGLTAPTVAAGLLELDQVTFGHGRLDPPLIENLALTIRPGMRVALVGASGSGKSTIGALAAGLYRPWAGQVRLDGMPIDAWVPEALAATMAYVDQEVFLFEGTLRDNLTLWKPSVADEVLERALADAAVLADIERRPGSLDCRVEEAGRNFSGGQRQRIEIARALVGDPALLVLDEATAALDPLVEMQIDNNLRRRGCACLLIAHRLSTIRDCDEIVVLEAGRVLERGTHTQLLASAGAYHRLIHAER